MEDVNKTVTTALGATPAHATLDMLAVASMDVWVCCLVPWLHILGACQLEYSQSMGITFSIFYPLK